jgi:hypothetical protein
LPRQQQQQQQQQEVIQELRKAIEAGIRWRESKVERRASRVGELPLLDQLLVLIETDMIDPFLCLSAR